MVDDFGTRMKAYEAQESERRFMPMVPVYARIDGRGFSSFTRGMERPYDLSMSECMVQTTMALVAKTNARIGYTQSDEISLVWQADRSDSSIFFDHRIAKMTSVLASLATISFAQALLKGKYADRILLSPHFDCRVFHLPNRTEAANAFLWREQDAAKNAISMAARSVYSHKELHKKSGPEMQEMLFARDINFNDYPSYFKRGTFVRKQTTLREFTAQEITRIPLAYRPQPGANTQRTVVEPIDMPRFSRVLNREAVIFNGAQPEVFDPSET